MSDDPVGPRLTKRIWLAALLAPLVVPLLIVFERVFRGLPLDMVLRVVPFSYGLTLLAILPLLHFARQTPEGAPRSWVSVAAGFEVGVAFLNFLAGDALCPPSTYDYFVMGCLGAVTAAAVHIIAFGWPIAGGGGASSETTRASPT